MKPDHRTVRRHTMQFSVPVKAFELDDLPPGPVNLYGLGLVPSDPDTTDAARDALRWPEGAQVYSGHGRTWLFVTVLEDQQYDLIPLPPERVAYETGDKVLDSSSLARRQLRVGVVTDSNGAHYRKALEREMVTVRWGGESQPTEAAAQQIQLDQGQPRFNFECE